MPASRRKNPIVSRRRVDDEGEDDGNGTGSDSHEDDSMSEGSLTDDELDASDMSRADSSSPANAKLDVDKLPDSATRPAAEEPKAASTIPSQPAIANGNIDTTFMLEGHKVAEVENAVEAIDYEDLKAGLVGPPIVDSTMANTVAQMDRPQELPVDRRRREHEEYKKKRDADPAFVPNRGAFFMHDHRHAGPAANGFRPFGRGRGGGRGGRAGFGVAFGPLHHVLHDETTSDQWTHDMHETVREPDIRNVIPRQPVHSHNSFLAGVPQAARGQPVNRSLSSTKVLGNVQVRILLPNMQEATKCPAIPWKQYTRLPDHRPPLRRDKPVRISLPNNPARYIFPAHDRSFVFIPRAMRPNQQGFGGRSNRGRSGMSSIGGYSRRTSIFGGSMYGTSYTPSVAMSRRSSIAYDGHVENVLSPTAYPYVQVDNSKPVVRLPPSIRSAASVDGADAPVLEGTEVDQPQNPTFRENRHNSIPLHQPRPQKSVSVAEIESPAVVSFNPPQQYQQPFHQQVPAQMNEANYSHGGVPQPHALNSSFSTQATTGTPLSQIPERAIHAQPFQPIPYQQQPYYTQPYPIMQPQQSYYYPQHYNQSLSGQAPAFQPTTQPLAPVQSDQQVAPANLVAQEVNGMVYYYNAADIPAVSAPPVYNYAQAQFPMQQYGVAGIMTPSPDGFYIPQAAPGVLYYQ